MFIATGGERCFGPIMFWGPFHAIQAVLPRMLEHRSGRIVSITSIGGKVSVSRLLPYNCAKFAVVGLSEGLRAELSKEGIPLTTVVPGLMPGTTTRILSLTNRFLLEPAPAFRIIRNPSCP